MAAAVAPAFAVVSPEHERPDQRGGARGERDRADGRPPPAPVRDARDDRRNHRHADEEPRRAEKRVRRAHEGGRGDERAGHGPRAPGAGPRIDQEGERNPAEERGQRHVAHAVPVDEARAEGHRIARRVGCRGQQDQHRGDDGERAPAEVGLRAREAGPPPHEPAREADEAGDRHHRVKARPVRVHLDRVGDGPADAVAPPVLRQAGLGEARAGPDQEGGGIDGIARHREVPQIPVPARRDPGGGEDEARAAHRAEPLPRSRRRRPERRDREDDQRGRRRADLDAERDAGEQARVPRLGRRVAGALAVTGDGEREGAEERGRLGEIRVREARGHDADALRRQEQQRRRAPTIPGGTPSRPRSAAAPAATMAA